MMNIGRHNTVVLQTLTIIQGVRKKTVRQMQTVTMLASVVEHINPG